MADCTIERTVRLVVRVPAGVAATGVPAEGQLRLEITDMGAFFDLVHELKMEAERLLAL